VLHFLGMADDIVVVATPDIASTLDAYGVIKASRQAELTARIHLLVNLVNDSQQCEMIATRICTCAERFLQYTPNVLGYLRKDRALGMANQNRSPLVTSRPRTANARRFRDFATALTADRSRDESNDGNLAPRMESLVCGLKNRVNAKMQRQVSG
jgi:flagellar biosynthesis protein FlhG